ncbi:MAG TPA: DNA-binding domain-containing protein [Steroidobacteraceae bacterium]
MPSLRELQSGVMHALLDGEPERAAPYIAAGAIAPEQALSVYASNARTHFIESLISSFPAVLRLVGEEYFRQCARGFHARHPSLSGDLQPAGMRFPQYLSQLHRDDEFRYLGEVARLEWLIQETLLAADHGPLDLAKLGAVAAGDYDDLRFILHPSVRLFASEFPCWDIWEANVGSAAEPELIDLGAGPDRVLLVRNGGQLKCHRLSHGEQAFLQSVLAGERFAAAVESGAHRGELDAAGGGFNAAVALQRWVLAGVLIDFQ